MNGRRARAERRRRKQVAVPEQIAAKVRTEIINDIRSYQAAQVLFGKHPSLKDER